MRSGSCQRDSNRGQSLQLFGYAHADEGSLLVRNQHGTAHYADNAVWKTDDEACVGFRAGKESSVVVGLLKGHWRLHGPHFVGLGDATCWKRPVGNLSGSREQGRGRFRALATESFTGTIRAKPVED